jgi:hypothetical protein
MYVNNNSIIVTVVLDQLYVKGLRMLRLFGTVFVYFILDE